MTAIATVTLSFTLSNGESFSHDLAQGRTVLGRSADCGLSLQDPGISRQHAALLLEADRLTAEDLGSSNGLFVNGARIEKAELADGDSIKIGGVVIEVALEAAGEAGDATVFFEAPAPEPEVGNSTVVRAAPASGKKSKKSAPAGRKRLILYAGAAAVVVLIFIVALSIKGGSKKKAQTPAAKPPAQAAQQAAPKEAAPAAKPAGQAAAPAPATGQAAGDKGQRVSKHLEQAQIYYDAGRWQDAMGEWRQALILDPNNELAGVRLKKVRDEISAKAQAALASGLQNYKFLKYQAAIQDWMQVLHLVPDANNPLHKKAKEYIEQARAKIKR